MKKHNIMMTLITKINQNDEIDTTELLTKAKFFVDGEEMVFEYEDTSATGYEGCVTTIRVKGNENVSIVRVGSVSSILTLEIGRKHFCQYGTPYGMIQIGVHTSDIKNSISENGELYLRYTLDMNASFVSENEITIKMNAHNHELFEISEN